MHAAHKALTDCLVQGIGQTETHQGSSEGRRGSGWGGAAEERRTSPPPQRGCQEESDTEGCVSCTTLSNFGEKKGELN